MTKIEPTLPGWYSPTQLVGSIRGIERQPTSPCPALPHCRGSWQGCRSRCDGTICAVWIAWRGDASATSSINVNSTYVTAFLPAPIGLQRPLQQPVVPAISSYPSEGKLDQRRGQSSGSSDQGVRINQWLFRLDHTPVDNIKAFWQIASVSMNSDLWLLPSKNY